MIPAPLISVTSAATEHSRPVMPLPGDAVDERRARIHVTRSSGTGRPMRSDHRLLPVRFHRGLPGSDREALNEDQIQRVTRRVQYGPRAGAAPAISSAHGPGADRPTTLGQPWLLVRSPSIEDFVLDGRS